MNSIKISDLQQVNGGFGYFPGYDQEAHIRAGNLLVGGAAGFLYGLVEGFWTTAVEYSK